MPHFTHTPETLLGRNDSKNPATTCKGITSSGRPCRRALAATKTSLIGRRKSNSSAVGGVVALVHEDGELQEADFYCWQHKDQAEQMMVDEVKYGDGNKNRKPNRRSTELFPLKEKSSIDTMVQKLGIDTVADSTERRKRTKNPKPPRRTETVDFATVEGRQSGAPHAEKYNLGGASQRPQGRAKKQSFWASLCCMAGDDDDYVEIVRHKKRVERDSQMASGGAQYSSPAAARPSQQRVSFSQTSSLPMSQIPSPNPTAGNLLSWLPTNLSPSTAAALLAELSKPVSVHDEEGYIYIFWLTPQSKDTPSESTARSLLASPGNPSRPSNARRISDVMTEYSFDSGESSRGMGTSGIAGGDKRSTIMLKIGRANNITRRMNEWQRQCGYALNLVRWYPYISSSPQPSPKSERRVLYPDLSRPATGRRQSSGEGVRKVPCVKRVERLIHLELGEKQVKRQCTACGKEHREWFEVEATQAGIKAVDEVVKRWVRWSEGQVQSS